MGKGNTSSKKRRDVSEAKSIAGKSKSKSSNVAVNSASSADEKSLSKNANGKSKKNVAASNGASTESWGGFFTKLVTEPSTVPKKKKMPPPSPSASSSLSSEEEEDDDDDDVDDSVDEEQESSTQSDEGVESEEEEYYSEGQGASSESLEEDNNVITSKRSKKAIKLNGTATAVAKKESKKESHVQELSKSERKQKKRLTTDVASNGKHVVQSNDSAILPQSSKKEMIALQEENAKLAKLVKKLHSKIDGSENKLLQLQTYLAGLFQKRNEFENATLGQIEGLKKTVARLEATVSESFLNPVPNHQDVAMTDITSSSRYGPVGGKASSSSISNSQSTPPGL